MQVFSLSMLYQSSGFTKKKASDRALGPVATSDAPSLAQGQSDSLESSRRESNRHTDWDFAGPDSDGSLTWQWLHNCFLETSFEHARRRLPQKVPRYEEAHSSNCRVRNSSCALLQVKSARLMSLEGRSASPKTLPAAWPGSVACIPGMAGTKCGPSTPMGGSPGTPTS